MKIKIPSKTFLWGEYGALVGGSAGVLVHKPFFEVSSEPANDLHHTSQKNLDEDLLIHKVQLENLKPLSEYFHPDSPAGYVLEHNSNLKKTKISFSDPYHLKGGFGRSTAEFIAVKILEDSQNWDLLNVYNSYLEVFDQNKKIRPSGYDLIAQMTGLDMNDSFQIMCLIKDKNNFSISTNTDFFSKVGVLILKTPIKIKTHEHLESLENKTLMELASLSEEVTNYFLNHNNAAFFEALKSFDKSLKAFGYLHQESQKYIDLINKAEGVYYCRGCGAMGADVIAVFYDLNYKEEVFNKIDVMSDLNLILNTK